MEQTTQVNDQYSGRSVSVEDVIYPTTSDEVRNLVLRASAMKKPLYFVSGGRNWGYGSGLPVQDGSTLISLEKMNQIISYDRELGVIEIEPGVTQGQLERYLDENGLNYYVPNTGAGPDGTIVGNALERGFGMAPIENHAQGLLCVDGFLADGTPYQSALSEVNPKLGSCFPMGIGPSLDAFIPQSSWLVVTKAKVQLIRRTEVCDVMILPFARHEFGQVADLLQQLSARIDLPTGGFKILNQRQLQHTLNDLPDVVRRFTPRSDWTLAFFIRSSKRLRRPIYSEVAQIIKDLKFDQHCSRWSDGKIGRAQKLVSLLPSSWRSLLQTPLIDLAELHRLGDGRTSMIGHKILKPEHGLLWLSPLCPLSSKDIGALTRIVDRWERMSADNKLPFQIATQTWTVLNQRTIALVLPLLFPLGTPLDFIHKSYTHMLEELRQHGFSPYRFPSDTMPYVTEMIAPRYFSLIQRIENALDPDRVINAHRYHA